MDLFLNYQNQIDAVLAPYAGLASQAFHVRTETSVFQLPPPVIESILSHCKWLDLVHLRQVSRYWRGNIKEQPDIADVLFDAYMYRRDGSRYDNDAIDYCGPLQLRVIIQPHPRPCNQEDRSQYIWTVCQLYAVEKQYNEFFDSIRKGLHSLRVYEPGEPVRMKFYENNRQLGEILEKKYHEWKKEGLCQPSAAEVDLHCTFRFDDREVSQLVLRLSREEGIRTHDILKKLKAAFSQYHTLYLDGILTKEIEQAGAEIARLKRLQTEEEAKSESQLEASESPVSETFNKVFEPGQRILEEVQAIEQCEGCREKCAEEPLCPRCEFIDLVRERLEVFASGARCPLVDDTIRRLAELKEALVPPFDSKQCWVDEGLAELSLAMNRIPAIVEQELVSATMLQLCVDTRPPPTLDAYLSRKCCPEGAVQWQCGDCGTLDIEYAEAWEGAINAFYFEERLREGKLDSVAVPPKVSEEDFMSFLVTESVQRLELEPTLWDLVEPVRKEVEVEVEVEVSRLPKAPEPELDRPESEVVEPSEAADESEDEFFSCDEAEEQLGGANDEQVETPHDELDQGVLTERTEVEPVKQSDGEEQPNGQSAARSDHEEQIEPSTAPQLESSSEERVQIEQNEPSKAEHVEQEEVQPRGQSVARDNPTQQPNDSAIELFQAQHEQNLRKVAAPKPPLKAQVDPQTDSAAKDTPSQMPHMQHNGLLNWLADVPDQPPPVPRRSSLRDESRTVPARQQSACRFASPPPMHMPRGPPTAINQRTAMPIESFTTTAVNAMLAQSPSPSQEHMSPDASIAHRRSPLHNQRRLAGNISPRPSPAFNQHMDIDNGMDSFVTIASRAILAQPPPPQQAPSKPPRE